MEREGGGGRGRALDSLLAWTTIVGFKPHGPRPRGGSKDGMEGAPRGAEAHEPSARVTWPETGTRVQMGSELMAPRAEGQ